MQILNNKKHLLNFSKVIILGTFFVPTSACEHPSPLEQEKAIGEYPNWGESFKQNQNLTEKDSKSLLNAAHLQKNKSDPSNEGKVKAHSSEEKGIKADIEKKKSNKDDLSKSLSK